MSTSSRHSAPPRAARSSRIDWQSVPAQQWCLIGGVVLILAGLGAYIAWPRVDDKAVLDRQIQEGWMHGRDVVDAWEFFEKGGAYENRDVAGTTDIDQKFVIPLIKQLREKHQLKVLVIVQEKPPQMAHLKNLPERAMAVIAEAPADRKSRNAIRMTILETADEFPGLLTQNWSHNWVSLDFFDEAEAQIFHRSGAYEKLKVSQRIME